MTQYSLLDVQRDWRCLDADDFSTTNTVHLISHLPFDPKPGLNVKRVAPGWIARSLRRLGVLHNLLYAWSLLRHTTSDSVLLLYGGNDLWLFVGLLNRYVMLRKRMIILWGVFVEVKDGWRRKVMTSAMSTIQLIALWSRRQIASHAEWLRLPLDRFVFIPYKANHTKGPSYKLPIENYVFAGGNGKRDYATLAEAVRDTGIPVIVSATDATVRGQIKDLPNLITVAAWEPNFAKLQAGARFTVVPMSDTGLKGGGEANMCNGMWHGKPVIAMDRMSAADYIVDGKTGYIISPGDVSTLRQRILDLWHDQQKCSSMGMEAKKHAEANFSHEAFVRRLLRLATLCKAHRNFTY